MTTPRQMITVIDRKIDTVRRTLRTLERIDRNSAESWQQAWDRHPELRAVETELFRQRGIAQLARDNQAALRRSENHIKQIRAMRHEVAGIRKRLGGDALVCPACGHRAGAAS